MAVGPVDGTAEVERGFTATARTGSELKGRTVVTDFNREIAQLKKSSRRRRRAAVPVRLEPETNRADVVQDVRMAIQFNCAVFKARTCRHRGIYFDRATIPIRRKLQIGGRAG